MAETGTAEKFEGSDVRANSVLQFPALGGFSINVVAGPPERRRRSLPVAWAHPRGHGGESSPPRNRRATSLPRYVPRAAPHPTALASVGTVRKSDCKRIADKIAINADSVINQCCQSGTKVPPLREHYCEPPAGNQPE